MKILDATSPIRRSVVRIPTVRISTVRVPAVHILLAHLGLLTALMGAFFLLRFPPAGNRFYPRCIFYSVFHLQCPGCGATRALAALLHGNLLGALHFNAAFVLLLPFIATYLCIVYLRAIRPQPFLWPTVPAAGLKIGLGVVLIFTLARDLYPF